MYRDDPRQPIPHQFAVLSLLAVGFAVVAQLPVVAQAVSPDNDAAETPKKEQSEDAPASQRDNKRQKVRFAHVTLTAALPESAGQAGPLGTLQTDLRKAIERIEQAADDKSITGAVLDLRQPAIGRGRIRELRGAVQRFRQSGKKIYALMEMGTPVDYLIAAACDEVVMPESGFLMLPGIHTEATFYKRMFDKLGIQADFLHIGPYKSAAQPFTRESLSPAVRENLTSVIDDIYDQMLTTIAADRLLTVDKVKAAIDEGLLSAHRAKEAGLIDRVQYADEFRSDLAAKNSAEPLVYVINYGKQDIDTDFSGPMGFVKLMQLMMGVKPGTSGSKDPKIALVYATGPIMTGKSQQNPFGGEIMGSTTIVEALREADEDDQVAAIVLRINSPGGSAVASDLIWRETRRIEKPIVASMSDVAGSGGYYIAMGADKIYAAPGTITGSIGVVTGKFGITGLYDKIGITTDTIQRGKNSGLFGSSDALSTSERAVMERFMTEVYEQFTRKAAEGRGMPLEELKSLAEGRIFTGRQAKRNGLVDDLGTLEDAIAAAKQLAGISPDQKVRLEEMPEPQDFFESLLGEIGKEEEVRMPAQFGSLAPELLESLRQSHVLRNLLQEPAILMMPLEVQIR